MSFGRMGARYGRMGASGAVAVERPIGPDRGVSSAWSGAVTDTTFRAAHYLDGETQGTRLAVSANSDLSSPVYSGYVDTTDQTVKHEITGLTAGTRYYFGIEVNGVVKDTKKGQFRTLPAVGTATNFRFGFGNCQSGYNTGSVLTTLRSLATPINFFQHIGDLHYDDIDEADEALFDASFEGVLGGTYSGPFLREVATFYIWDDHDYGPNDGDSTSVTRETAVAVYKRRVPSPDLEFSAATGPICYSYVVGRVRMIVTEARSQRTTGAIWGASQVDWIKSEFTAAAAAGQFAFLFVPATWQHAGDWSTSAATLERQDVAEHIRSSGMGRKTIIFGGDAHQTMADDGASYDYSVKGGAPVPEVHAAALFAGANKATGYVWSEDIVVMDGTTRRSLAGVVDVTDGGGDTITVEINAYRTNNVATTETIDATYTFTLPSTPPTAPAAFVQMAMRSILNASGDWSPVLDTPATAGNLLLVLVAIGGARPTTFTTTGLTNIGNQGNGGGSTGDADITILAYYMAATGGETTVTLNAGSARYATIALIELDSTSSSPVDQFDWDDQSNNASATGVTLGVTTTVDNCIGVAVCGIDVPVLTQGAPRTWSDDFIEQYWAPKWDAGLPGMSIAMKQLGAAGAVAAEFSEGGAADQMSGLLIALKPN